MEPEREAVKADALDVLRTALVTGEDTVESVRWCWYRNPMFSAALFTEAVRARFGPGCDIRALTRFIARHRSAGSAGPVGFPVREAEALMRAALGETALLDAVHPGQFNYPEIGSVLLAALFQEWRPEPGEIDGLLEGVGNTLQAAYGLSPHLHAAEEDWFTAGMHDSPLLALDVTADDHEAER